jgi:hypothetical protein
MLTPQEEQASKFVKGGVYLVYGGYVAVIVAFVLAISAALIFVGYLLGIAWWKMLILIGIIGLLYLLSD